MDSAPLLDQMDDIEIVPPSKSEYADRKVKWAAKEYADNVNSTIPYKVPLSTHYDLIQTPLSCCLQEWSKFANNLFRRVWIIKFLLFICIV